MTKNYKISLLKNLKEISLNIGNNKDYVQASGGNTSCKICDDMYVKASGKCLKNALDENIFISTKFRKISENIKNGEINNYQISSIDSKLRASIETALHAIMPNTFVIHSHPIDVIAQTVLKNSKVEI